VNLNKLVAFIENDEELLLNAKQSCSQHCERLSCGSRLVRVKKQKHYVCLFRIPTRHSLDLVSSAVVFCAFVEYWTVMDIEK
jgi:hypothetical protein